MFVPTALFGVFFNILFLVRIFASTLFRPFSAHRVIDLAHGAAHELGLISSGIAQVRLEVLR